MVKYKVLGQNLVEGKPGEFSLEGGQKAWHAILEEKGVTEEVRRTVVETVGQLAEECYKVEGQILKDNEELDRATINCGTGNFALDTSIVRHRHHSGQHPTTKEPFEADRFAIPSIGLEIRVPGALRKEGGVLAELEADFSKRFAKKK